MPTKDWEFEAVLDDSQIVKSLENIQRDMLRLAKQGDRAFKSMGKASRASGINIGATSGVVEELTSRFIDMGVEATRALGNVVVGGVELNKQLETIQRVLSAAFGDPNLGKEAIAFLDETAEKLNISKDLARQFGQAILPKTDNLENFTELLRLADIQADTTGASLRDELAPAIREALSGDFSRFTKQFDVGAADVAKIRELAKEVGFAAAIVDVLGKEFETLGKVNIADTLATDIKSVQGQFIDLQAALGAPVFDESKEFFSDLGGVLSERGDDFELIAAAIGDVVANILDFVGSGLTDFLQNLDKDQIIEIANTFFDIVENVRNLSEVLGLVEFPQAFINSLQTVAEKLAEASTTAVQLVGIFKAKEARSFAEALKSRQLGGKTVLGINVTSFSQEEQAEIETAGQEAFNAVIEETALVLAESSKRAEENTDKQRERAETQKEATTVDTDALNAKLALDVAEKAAAKSAAELAQAQEDATKAQEKFNAATEKLDTSETRKELDLLIKSERDAIDAALDAARAREKIASDNAKKIAKITGDNVSDVAAATADLSQDQQNTAIQAAQDQADLETDLAKKRADIETNFRRRIQSIQAQFAQSAEDAVRTRDASAFRRAQRTRDTAVSGAETTRQQSIDDLKIEGKRRRDELTLQQERELEDAKLTNNRKLADLKIALDEVLESQRLANEQAFAAQTESETRKQEQLAQDRIRDEEDLQRSLDRRREDLQKSLDSELATISTGEAAKRAEYEKTAAAAETAASRVSAAAATAAQASQSFNPANAGFSGSNPSTILAGLRHGGAAQAGKPFLVGEGGPELFVPNVSGRVIPNTSLPQNLPMLAQTTTNSSSVDNSIRASMSLVDPAAQTAEMRAITQNEILKAFKEVFKSR